MRTRGIVRALATLLLGPLVVALALVASPISAVVDGGAGHDRGVTVAVPTVHVTVHVQPSAALPDDVAPQPRAGLPDDDEPAPHVASHAPAAPAPARGPPDARA